MSLKDLVSEDRRLAILRYLDNEPDRALNDSVLQTALAAIGHGVSRDAVRTDLAWLAEQNLVTVEKIHDHVHVARLTQRGADVSAGRTTVPGVKRPAPGE